MFRTSILRGVATAVMIVLPSVSLAEIIIDDAYARTSRPNAPTGAAFMQITNTGASEDRLIAARSEIAKRVELHTHVDEGNGVMRMTEIEGGIAVPAGTTHAMKRGGDHVMFMGLGQNLAQGDAVTVTLVFEQAGEVVVEIPVDNERQPDHGGMSHGEQSHDHGTKSN